jgi:hypothetical protein
VSETLERTERPPAEFLGKARDIRRRVAREDTEYDRTVDALIAPVQDRLRRYPQRSLRQEMLIAFIQDWRFMPCRDWRLCLDAKLSKGRASLIEYRLVAGQMRRPDDPNWVGMEEDLAAIKVEVLVNRSSVKIASKATATFSLHAIARRVQRGLDASDEALMHDFLVAAALDPDTLPGAGGYKVTTHPDGSGWRGRTVRQKGPDGVSRRVLSVRTWLT